MKLVKEKIECSGCSACSERCPFNAIRMICDDEGFYYPYIDESLCANCGLCTKICNNIAISESGAFSQKYYAVKSKNILDRMRSRSGGIFFELAKKIIDDNGAVYGVVLKDNIAKTIRATFVEDVVCMQGSKYVESDIFGTYIQAENDMLNGLKVLFSGTACQIAGLYGYLSTNKKVDMDLLYTIDIVCHGVASRKIFKDYISFIEKKYNGTVEKFNFRDKKFGWNTHIETFEISKKTICKNNYTSLFYTNLCLRPSCGNCKFASYNRPADITIADFWALEKTVKGFDDNKGVSAVIVNNEKGKDLFSSIFNNIDFKEVDKKTCSQPNLHNPTQVSSSRADFWNLYQKKGFKSVLKKYGRYDFFRRIKWHLDLMKLKNNK